MTGRRGRPVTADSYRNTAMIGAAEAHKRLRPSPVSIPLGRPLTGR